MPPDVIVVLGCRIGQDGLPSPPALRRVQRAASAFRERPTARIVVAGGRRWHGVSEADAISRVLIEQGVPEQAIAQENWSLSTLENARYVAHLLQGSGCRQVYVVTCDWHMARALHCFRLVGFTAEALPARSPRVGVVQHGLRAALEWTRVRLTRVPPLLYALLALLNWSACQSSTPPARSDGGATPSGSARSSSDDARLARLSALEGMRDAQGVSAADLQNRNVEIRRRAARALARIADARSAELLAAALADEDVEVARWAAYGLGATCKGRAPEVVRRIATRGASFRAGQTPGQPAQALEDALADALGRCSVPEAEQTLRAWLAGPRTLRRSAARALGRMAAERQRLDDSSLVALLDAADDARGEPLIDALFAFTRLPSTNEPLASRLADVAKRALKVKSPERAFAVRALGRAGTLGVPELARVLESSAFLPSERADAARELARLGQEGQSALVAALSTLLPAATDRAKVLMSNQFGVISSVLDGLRPGAA
ncbi:MAG TPA: YdcF family protein, partial [Polyangiales bacterium]|nr:YdcF family protein [Polyangiales bacterium]